MTSRSRLVLIASLAMAALLLVLLSPNVRRNVSGLAHPDPVGPTAHSKSAIGHAALFHLLRTLGIHVSTSEAGSSVHLDPGSVLVIAEPRVDDATLQEVRAMLSAETVFLVLPKRVGKADPRRANWLGEDRLVPDEAVAKVLHLVDPHATFVRAASNVIWMESPSGVPSLEQPQLIRSHSIRPLLASAEGTLIGERRKAGRTVVVLSDPDLIANHGLVRGDNALIAVSLIESLRGARGGAVIFDEFVHGFSPHAFHMLGILFQFPFALVTMQMGLAIALLAWAATARFGAPASLAPPIEAGRRSLIEAGARLLDRAAQSQLLAERYFESMVRDAARELRAPRGLDLAGLLGWLSQTGKAPRIPGAAGDPQQAAREVYLWRKELADGPDEHSQGSG